MENKELSPVADAGVVAPERGVETEKGAVQIRKVILAQRCAYDR